MTGAAKFGGQRGGVQAVVLTEADILHAAVAVARTSGLDGLTVKAVAEHLGITSPSLYYHVRDGRAALVAMVASHALEHTFSGRLQARAGESWIDALVRVLLGAADLVEEFPGVVGHVADADRGCSGQPGGQQLRH
ncbi:MAG: TetR family transcriptional regulator [Mycobacterium sp.]